MKKIDTIDTSHLTAVLGAAALGGIALAGFLLFNAVTSAGDMGHVAAWGWATPVRDAAAVPDIEKAFFRDGPVSMSWPPPAFSVNRAHKGDKMAVYGEEPADFSARFMGKTPGYEPIPVKTISIRPMPHVPRVQYIPLGCEPPVGVNDHGPLSHIATRCES